MTDYILCAEREDLIEGDGGQRSTRSCRSIGGPGWPPIGFFVVSWIRYREALIDAPNAKLALSLRSSYLTQRSDMFIIHKSWHGWHGLHVGQRLMIGVVPTLGRRGMVYAICLLNSLSMPSTMRR